MVTGYSWNYKWSFTNKSNDQLNAGEGEEEGGSPDYGALRERVAGIFGRLRDWFLSNLSLLFSLIP